MAGSTTDPSYIETEQFALNFPLVMTAISNFMKTEYNEGRLVDTNYATVQAQAIQSAIQATITLTMQTDSQANQAALILSQKNLVDEQAAQVEPNAVKQREVQDAQIAQVAAETSYTSAKETTMVESRIDNLVIEDLKAQMQQIATVGAGGLVPDTHDFSSANSLREALYKRAKGEVLPNITFTASTTYTKAT